MNYEVSVDEIAQALGISGPTVRARIRAGALPGCAVGSRYVVYRAEWDEFLAGQWRPSRIDYERLAKLTADEIVQRLQWTLVVAPK